MKFLDFFKKRNVAINATNKKEREINMGCPQISTERPTFTPDNINTLAHDEIFVFGSNLAGHHGGGSARTALNKFGAIYGQGVGLQGQSYAIPTMQGGVETIVQYVDEFIDFAKEHPEKIFYVTRIGCGIAGFSDKEIAPLFRKALKLSNVCLPESFAKELDRCPIPESYKIKEYGRARTLVDIIKTLNEEHHYTTFESLMTDFNKVFEQYKQRETIPEGTFDLIHSIFHENKNYLFKKGKLDIVHLEETVTDQKKFYDNLEIVFHKRSVYKLIKIIQLFNKHKQYKSLDSILIDLNKLKEHRNSLSDFAYSFSADFYSRRIEGVLRELWEKITKEGKLDNDLLEKAMFGQHNKSVKELGLHKVIKRDYEAHSCYTSVYYPRTLDAMGPIYIKESNGTFSKSCGYGSGPLSASEDINDYACYLLSIINIETDP